MPVRLRVLDLTETMSDPASTKCRVRNARVVFPEFSTNGGECDCTPPR